MANTNETVFLVFLGLISIIGLYILVRVMRLPQSTRELLDVEEHLT